MSQFNMYNSAVPNAFAGDGGFAGQVLGFANDWGAGIKTGLETGRDTLGLIADTYSADIEARVKQCIAQGGDEFRCRQYFEQAAGRTEPVGQQANMSMNPSMGQPYRINWGA